MNNAEFMAIVSEHFEEYLSDVLPYIDICKVSAIEAAVKIAARSDMSAEAFAENVLQGFLSEFGDKYKTLNMDSRIGEWVKSHYEYWRHEFPVGDLFPELALKDYPELRDWSLPLDQNLAMPDQRTQDFLSQSDYIYLGKYIQGEDSQRRLRDFIRDEYIDKGTAIGNNPAAISEFKKQFREYADFEDWKVRRIIDTSVNQTRNFAHIRSLQQCGAEMLEVAGPDDNLTCSYCANMLGRQFRVSAMASALDQIVATNPESLPVIKPFLTSSYKSADDLGAYQDSELEVLHGISVTPPYHPHCRHRMTISVIAPSALEELSEQAELSGNVGGGSVAIPPPPDGLETDAAKDFNNLSDLLGNNKYGQIKKEIMNRKDVISGDFADIVKSKIGKDDVFREKWSRKMPTETFNNIRNSRNLNEVLEILDKNICSTGETSISAEFMRDIIDGAGGHHKRENQRILVDMFKKLKTDNGDIHISKKIKDQFDKRISELPNLLDPIGVLHPSILKSASQKIEHEISAFKISMKNIACLGETNSYLSRRIEITIGPATIITDRNDGRFFAKVFSHELIHHCERTHDFRKPFSHYIFKTDDRNVPIFWRDYARNFKYKAYQERMTTTSELLYVLKEMEKPEINQTWPKELGYKNKNIFKDHEAWNLLWGMIRGYYADIY